MFSLLKSKMLAFRIYDNVTLDHTSRECKAGNTDANEIHAKLWMYDNAWEVMNLWNAWEVTNLWY